MRYNIDGFEIRSENAAKPPSQASSYVVSLLEELSPYGHVLDFGCGKLRYACHLYHLSKRLTVVDSEEQLDRGQIVHGERTTVRDFVTHRWHASRALGLRQFRNDKMKYGFVLCSNVLSSIPDCEVRLSALKLVADRLTRKGKVLIVCQYTNSYFCNRMRDPKITKYNDGFILGNKENASFYGLLRPKQLLSYIDRASLAVSESWIRDQSAYVLAERKAS